jgi:RNA polymerase sigma-70 factor (ECF subfamily)
MRATTRRREVELPPERGGAADHAFGAEPAAARHDPPLHHALEQAIAALPDGLRTVYVLRAVEECAHAEIAALLEISVGTSEVRFHRAVRALRAALGHLR